MPVQIGRAEALTEHAGNSASASRISTLQLLGMVRVDLPASTTAAVALQLYQAEWQRHMALMRKAVAEMEQDGCRATQAAAGQPAPTGGPP